MLGNFGKLNGLWGSRENARLELSCSTSCSPLAAERAGGVAWEYYFNFGGGRPPWVSGLAQGTAVQALARAATRLDREADVLPVAQRALADLRGADAAGRARAGRARRPLRDLLVRARPAGAQRLHPVARSASTTTRGCPATRAATALFLAGRAAGPRGGAGCTTPAPGRCTRAGARTHESDARLPRPAAGLPRGPLHADRDRRLLHDGRALRAVQERSRRWSPSSRARLRGGTAGPRALRAVEDLQREPADQARRARSSSRGRSASVGYGKRTFGWDVPRRRGDYTVELMVRDLAGNAGRRHRHGRGAEAQAQEATTRIAGAWRLGSSSTRARAASGRRRSPPPPPAAAPRPARARSCSRPTPRTRSPSRCRPPVGAEPTEVGGGVWAQQVQAQDELEQQLVGGAGAGWAACSPSAASSGSPPRS